MVVESLTHIFENVAVSQLTCEIDLLMGIYRFHIG